jgi:hypothetical protein
LDFVIVISDEEKQIFNIRAIRAQRLHRVWYAVVQLPQEGMGDGSGATLIEAVTVAHQRALEKEA